MINCNRKRFRLTTDTSDPCTSSRSPEDVLSVVDRESLRESSVQFGGQTPLNLALELKRNGVRSLARRRNRLTWRRPPQVTAFVDELKIPSPRTARRFVSRRAARVPAESAFPFWCAQVTCWRTRHGDRVRFEHGSGKKYVARQADGSGAAVLIDQFLEEASEVDVDRSPTEMTWSRGAWSTSKKPACIRRFFVRVASGQFVPSVWRGYAITPGGSPKPYRWSG